MEINKNMSEHEPLEKPPVFEEGVESVVDTVPAPEMPEQEAVGHPDHQPRPRPPFGDEVITNNMNAQYTASPPPQSPAIEKPRFRDFTDGERKDCTDPEKKERFATGPFRQANDRDGSSR